MGLRTRREIEKKLAAVKRENKENKDRKIEKKLPVAVMSDCGQKRVSHPSVTRGPRWRLNGPMPHGPHGPLNTQNM